MRRDAETPGGSERLAGPLVYFLCVPASADTASNPALRPRRSADDERDWADRLLAVVGRDPAEWLEPKLAAFIAIFAVHCAFREWTSLFDVNAPVPFSEASDRILPLAIIFSVCAVGCLLERTRGVSLAVVVAALTYKGGELAPTWSNHFTIEWITGVFLLLGSRHRDRYAMLCLALKWLLFAALFWSGAQKALHGTYFEGTYLAYAISHGARFADFFAWVLPAAEVDRLLSVAYPGPYRLESWLGIALANGIWIGEISCALMLLSDRLRPFGAVGALFLLTGIELAAREFMFGLLFLNLLLLYPHRDWNRRLSPLFLVAYCVLLLNRTGVIDIGVTN